MPAVLGYWKVRGLGQSIRLLLEYTGTEYEDKQYEMKLPDYKTLWLKEKFDLGLDFPNLPYYIDGPHRLTQSNAIMRYIARKHDMGGKTDEDVIKVDILENEATDFRSSWIKLLYCEANSFKIHKRTYIEETLPNKLEQLNKFIGDNKWFIGSELTYPDFLLYELLDINKKLDPECLSTFPNLEDFVDRFESLDAIKKYRNSPRCLTRPIAGPQAAFGAS